ncbi:hypothetical protein [Bradyrhizobium valentinum]|uniref:hypothetical protein n=1 Tax=Bradyrhizobium valentinum TaxID=1518501 RepID=UPI0018D20763|nr:hypothetical protein [Bradyrhizobium valentinum]
MTTRMVSPKPLSDFVPDVTLIAFPIPASLARTVAERFPHANRLIRSRQENGLNTDVEGLFRRYPESALARTRRSRRFRRLLVGAQSSASSKLHNPLINQ